MYMAKSIAAFVMLVVTALLAAPDVIPIEGRVKAIVTVISIVAGAIIVYRVPNKDDGRV